MAVSDFFKNLFDFESWAPKSSRVWRLQQFDYTPAKPEELEAALKEQEQLDILKDRIGELNKDAEAPATKSFSDSDDSEVAESLLKRVQQIATTSGDDDVEIDEEDMREPMTGKELRRLVFDKYGKTYDMSFVRRDFPGKTFVCLNIMWTHLEQRSFKMSEEQYVDKLDAIASILNVLGQTDKVRSFMLSKARSQKGMPPRPVVGTAISIQFDLEQEVIKEWFSQGYQ